MAARMLRLPEFNTLSSGHVSRGGCLAGWERKDLLCRQLIVVRIESGKVNSI